MRKARTVFVGVLAVLIVLLGLMVLWLFGGGRSAADWRQVHAVAFESDDWGLAGFVPRAIVLQGLDRSALAGERFPQVYWESTLEDSVTVDRLVRLLLRFHDGTGLPPVFQANYIMSSYEYGGGRAANGPLADSSSSSGSSGEEALPNSVATATASELWRRYDLPAFPASYPRPGMWEAVEMAIARGVWQAELHGSFHYDPQLRREAVSRDPLAREAAERGVLVFPGSQRAWELGPWRPTSQLAEELDHSLWLFAELFGRPPHSVIAPDYVWDARCEDLWESRGMNVIQAKREQRHPRRRGGAVGERLAKAWERAVSRLFHPDRIYLERNCRLEAVQATDWRQVAVACYEDVQQAWQTGEPAVVETHRINFVHLRPEVAEAGHRALAYLLELLCAAKESALVFLTDGEIAQLSRTGTSWSLRGDRVVVRNYSHSRRVVEVPRLTLADAQRDHRVRLDGRDSQLVQLEPFQTLLLPLADPVE